MTKLLDPVSITEAVTKDRLDSVAITRKILRVAARLCVKKETDGVSLSPPPPWLEFRVVGFPFKCGNTKVFFQKWEKADEGRDKSRDETKRRSIRARLFIVR